MNVQRMHSDQMAGDPYAYLTQCQIGSDTEENNMNFVFDMLDSKDISVRQKFVNAYLKLESELSKQSKSNAKSTSLSSNYMQLDQQSPLNKFTQPLIVNSSIQNQAAIQNWQEIYKTFPTSNALSLRLLSNSAHSSANAFHSMHLPNSSFSSPIILNPINSAAPNQFELNKLITNDSFASCSLKSPEVPREKDERRRATHNEVERRRRDKINTWIMKLAKLVPKCANDQSKYGQSKGGILAKAYDYILEMNETKANYDQAIQQNKHLINEMQILRQQNFELAKECEQLRNSIKLNNK